MNPTMLAPDVLIPVKHTFRAVVMVLTVAEGGTPSDTFCQSFPAEAARQQ
jgi:hypothetical protein